MFRPFLKAIALIATLGATPVLAQAPPSPVSHTGAIISTSDDSVTLAAADGQVVVAMSPGWTVGAPRLAAPADIKPGDFIATTNTNVDAATGRSTEVRILEPGYRPEYGNHGMPQPNTSMTHALVASTQATSDGVRLEVTYPGGGRTIVVPAATRVTAYDLRDRSAAHPGVVVTAVTRKGSDGIPRAGRLLIVDH